MAPPALSARSGLTGLVFLVLLAGASLLPATPAHGQLHAVSQAMQPDYFTRDLLVFIEGLELDETQSVIAEAIFDDYEQQFVDGTAAMELQIEALTSQVRDMRDNVDNDELLEMVVKPIQDWMVRREELNQQLIENVRVILLPDQQERWTAFDRQLFREKKLDQGRLSGERIDLFVIARDLNLPATEEPLRSLLRDYAIDLNRELRRRTVLIEGASSDLLNTLRARQFDPEEDLEQKRKINGLRVDVRNVNDRYRDVIAEAIPAPGGDQFRMEVLRRAYPKIYRRTNAQRVFDDAIERNGPEGPSADAERYEAILAIYDEFLAKLDRLNAEMYDVTRESEAALEMIRLENALRRIRGEELLTPEDPVRELQKDKRELERQYIDRLRALMGDELFSELSGAARYVPPPAAVPPATTKGAAQKGLQLNPKGPTLPPPGDGKGTPSGKGIATEQGPRGVGAQPDRH